MPTYILAIDATVLATIDTTIDTAILTAIVTTIDATIYATLDTTIIRTINTAHYISVIAPFLCPQRAAFMHAIDRAIIKALSHAFGAAVLGP